MKKYLQFFIVLIIGIFIGWQLKPNPPTPPNPPKHPNTAIVQKIIDGDTFSISDEKDVRLLMVNAEKGLTKAQSYLVKNILNKKVYLEYDRYQDDPYGRILAWVWIDCESDSPQFLPADYMHKSQNESNVGLADNPEGCKNGKLINEELVKLGFAKVEVYKGRGELKYQKRISRILLP